MTPRRNLPVSVFLLVLSAGWSQLPTGRLFGTVTDVAGVPLSGANVLLASEALLGGLADPTSGGTGDFRFVGLPPGVYRLEVRLPGFGT